MPRPGLVIGAGRRGAGGGGQIGTGIAPEGVARLSQATIAFTRGSRWPTNDTPEAPKECPARPTRLRSSSDHSGLAAAWRPSATRRLCLGEWSVPVVQLLTGR